MSLFSEKLKETIAGTGMTVYTLAKKAGVNRPMIHKSQQGDSIPSDDFIRKISEAMMLTNGEKKELLQLAGRARMGESLYLKRKAVLKVINCLCTEFDEMDLVALKKTSYSKCDCHGEYVVLENSSQIKSLLIELFKEKGTASKEEHIYVNLPEWAKAYFSIIYHLWCNKESNNIHLTQLIGIEKEYHSDYSAARNLSLISYAVNFALLPGKRFDAYYHYLDYPDSLSLPALPYFIKTEDSILAISSNLDVGVYYTSGSILEFYNRSIQECLDSSRPLIEYETNIMKMFDYGDSFSLIESIPCISTVMTDDLVEEIVKKEIPNHSGIVGLAQKTYGQWQETNHHPDSFFQIDKLEKFMNDGMLPAIPSYFINPLDKEKRVEILKSFIKWLETDEQERYHALNKKRLNLLVDAEIVYSRERGVMIRCFIENSPILKIVWIREQSCVEAFKDFFEYLPSSNVVLSQEEMKKQMEMLLKKHML